MSSRATAYPLAPLPPISSVACGSAHTAAVARDLSCAFTWGAGAHGQLGLGSEFNTDIPFQTLLPPPLTVLAAACGASHTLFLVSNGRFSSALESGDTAFAEAPATIALAPVQVMHQGQALMDISNIYAGGSWSAAALDNGRLLVWARSRSRLPRDLQFGGGEEACVCVAAALGDAVSYVAASQ
jgi:alpha-tubulin suppressor-like RCC1 family protein